MWADSSRTTSLTTRPKNSSLPMLRDAPAAGRAFLVVDEHQVDVAAVVQLLAAELAEGQDDAAGRLAGAGVRLAEALADVAQGRRQRDLQGGVGDARDVARDLLQRPIADDVVGADAQDLPLAEAAKGAQHRGVLEGGIDLGLQLVLQSPSGWDCGAAARAACRGNRDWRRAGR